MCGAPLLMGNDCTGETIALYIPLDIDFSMATTGYCYPPIEQQGPGG